MTVTDLNPRYHLAVFWIRIRSFTHDRLYVSQEIFKSLKPDRSEKREYLTSI
jgi:hypothetical protein